MKTAIYPGSFDPMTLGHFDVMERAARLFGKLIVAVAQNDQKSPSFSTAERVEMLREATRHLSNIQITSFDGLLVDFARKKKAFCVIRGLRAVSDFEFEFQLALMNRKLEPRLETIFLTPREEWSYLSSRMVKEIARLGGPVGEFVPPHVAEALSRRFAPQKETP